MKLLVLGGTVFLGRHVVDVALARGHEVTLFNRGQHNAELYPQAEKLRGNRDGDLTALRGRSWDAVVDTCGYLPRVVRAAADLLSGAVGHYTFISTISVYADPSVPGVDEGAPVAALPDETVEEITGETYGPLKALCEQAVERALPGRALIIRPGLIVGPHDPTDRFTYWPHRIAQGGEVLAPAPPEQQVQIIDVRDLAAWTIHMVKGRRVGTYNAAGPDYPLTMGRLLAECQATSGGDARLVWADPRFLLDAGAVPWSEVPLWIPTEGGVLDANTVACRRAIAAGLTFRPLADTVRATLAWEATRPSDYQWRSGLAPQKERELLQATGTGSR